jgi:hypothetical protein
MLRLPCSRALGVAAILEVDLNWEAVGAVGELVGAVAVVITLIYLSAQVRQNTRAVRGARFDSLARGQADIFQALLINPALNEIQERGSNAWDELSVEEKRVCNLILVQNFRFWENAFYQWREGMLEPWLWESQKNVMLSHFYRPGVQQWWSQRRMAFSREFGRFLEDSPASADPVRSFTHTLSRPQAADPSPSGKLSPEA